MNITFSTDKIKGQERKAILQIVQDQAKTAALEAIRPILQSTLEAELQVKLGRAKYVARTVSSQPRLCDWQCAGCGCVDANQFIRDGHYQRQLQTGWGTLNHLKIPMVECVKCGHDVRVYWTILEKYQHFWLDLDHKALFGSGFQHSLRQMAQEWSVMLGSSVGLRSIEERINRLEPLVLKSHQAALIKIPPVVQFDGIWFSLQTQTDLIKQDKRGRQRRVHRGERRVVLVALGLWPDGTRQIIDWDVAKAEDQASWETLLNRLYERGLQPEGGLKVIVRDGGGGLGEAVALVYGGQVIEQRCIFHKLQNVHRDCSRPTKEDQAGQTRRKAFLGEAQAIYQAESAEEALSRLKALEEKWVELEPKAVVTMGRDFEQTIAYYQLEPELQVLARSTSRLERTNRELRRKFNQVGSYGSERGASVGIYLQIERLNGQWVNESWWEVSQELLYAMFDINP